MDVYLWLYCSHCHNQISINSCKEGSSRLLEQGMFEGVKSPAWMTSLQFGSESEMTGVKELGF